MCSVPFCGKTLAFAAAMLLAAGCRGGGGSSTMVPAAVRPGAGSLPLERSPLDKIKHIVIVVQENRSFNDLFYGFIGATTAKYGYADKEKITLQPIGLATKWDLEHNSQGFIAACNGTGKIPGTDCAMNGFNHETWTCHQTGRPKCPIKYPPYSYVPHSETMPYFSMGHQYVLADQMYASNFDTSSYISHQYIIAAQGGQALNYPKANWGCPGGTPDTIPWIMKKPVTREAVGYLTDCFDYKTLGDELDKARDSWAFYANSLGKPSSGGKTCGKGAQDDYIEHGIWSSYQAIKHICYGADWDKDIIDPPAQFLTDVKNGSLRDVTWITPLEVNSDHPGSDSDTGPSWVASLVNAVGESQFWNSTAIFIFWDDYGGFYDPEPPAYVDYDGLGARIPLLIISPYSKEGWVSHVHYEHGSILKFVEDRFGLPRLAASDTRATSPEKDSFDFSKPPRKFVPIKSKYDENYFLHQPPDYRPPDTN